MWQVPQDLLRGSNICGICPHFLFFACCTAEAAEAEAAAAESSEESEEGEEEDETPEPPAAAKKRGPGETAHFTNVHPIMKTIELGSTASCSEQGQVSSSSLRLLLQAAHPPPELSKTLAVASSLQLLQRQHPPARVARTLYAALTHMAICSIVLLVGGCSVGVGLWITYCIVSVLPLLQPLQLPRRLSLQQRRASQQQVGRRLRGHGHITAKLGMVRWHCRVTTQVCSSCC